MNGAELSVPRGTPRKQIIITAIAKALEDALPSIPADSVPLRRAVFTFVLEFREERVVVVDADVTVCKPRSLTFTIASE